MSTLPDRGTRTLRFSLRLLNSALWLLAAAFAFALIVSAVSLVHDDSRPRETMRRVSQDKAIEIAALASERLAPVKTNDPATIAAAFADLLGDSTRFGKARLVWLDSGSVTVTLDGKRIYGPQPDNTRFQSTALLHAPHGDVAVTVSLAGYQLPGSVLFPFNHQRLAINGIFFLGTLLALIAAVAASRRQLLLAQERSDFIAGVSHDLRMPLAQILLASETLSLGRERTVQDRTTLTTSILREARRLIALVDNVLLVSRTGAVALAPRIQPVPLSALFTEVAEAVHLAADDAGQTIEASADESLIVSGDRTLLRQAFVNLIDNALKYGAHGQRIRLAATGTGGMVTVTVDDEGPGIPRDKRDALFEPYRRLERDLSSERTGSGLGLAVVRQIIVACGGTVRIADAPAEGTRVVVELPRAKSPS